MSIWINRNVCGAGTSALKRFGEEIENFTKAIK